MRRTQLFLFLAILFHVGCQYGPENLPQLQAAKKQYELAGNTAGAAAIQRIIDDVTQRNSTGHSQTSAELPAPKSAQASTANERISKAYRVEAFTKMIAGQYADATRLINLAIQESHDPMNIADCYGIAGQNYKASGNYDYAITSFGYSDSAYRNILNQLLAISGALSPGMVEAVTAATNGLAANLTTEADIQRIRKQYMDSENSLRRAMQLYSTIPDAKREIQCMIELSHLYIEVKDVVRAEAILNQAQDDCMDCNNLNAVEGISIASSKSELYEITGRYNECLFQCQVGLSLLFGDFWGMALLNGQLGWWGNQIDFLLLRYENAVSNLALTNIQFNNSKTQLINKVGVVRKMCQGWKESLSPGMKEIRIVWEEPTE